MTNDDRLQIESAINSCDIPTVLDALHRIYLQDTKHNVHLARSLNGLCKDARYAKAYVYPAGQAALRNEIGEKVLLECANSDISDSVIGVDDLYQVVHTMPLKDTTRLAEALGIKTEEYTIKGVQIHLSPFDWPEAVVILRLSGDQVQHLNNQIIRTS